MQYSKENIRKFIFALKDDNTNYEKAFDFIHTMHRISAKESVPLVEVITVLKYQKPHTYNYLKARTKHQLGLAMLFDLSINYDVAKERLGLE